jgi:hypothetical protein
MMLCDCRFTTSAAVTVQRAADVAQLTDADAESSSAIVHASTNAAAAAASVCGVRDDDDDDDDDDDCVCAYHRWQRLPQRR